VDELDLLRFSFELVAGLRFRLVEDDVGLLRLPVDAPNARDGTDLGADDDALESESHNQDLKNGCLSIKFV
jgi:hypothetical protein